MPRPPIHGKGKRKKITTVSMPAGMYEFFRRYSGRELNASNGISLAILTLVQKNIGARNVMGSVVADGHPLPDDVIAVSTGWERNEMAQKQAKVLRETGLAYDAQLREASQTARQIDEDALPLVGAPTLFEESSGKYAITLTKGEAQFLDRLGYGLRSLSQGLRFVIEELLVVDPEASQLLCRIAAEGDHFVPQLFVEIASCNKG